MNDEQLARVEVLSLELARDTRNELVHVLKSLGGHVPTGALENFIFYSANQMNKAAEAYLILRQAQRVDASKLLIRPTIEIMLKTRAAKEKPDLFYRTILNERLKRRQWIKGVARRQGAPFDPAGEEADWNTFREHCIITFPDTDVTNQGLSVRGAAKAIGLEDYYDSFYPLYCSFTHGAFESVMGLLDPISDGYDNNTVALCVFSTIEVLRSIGGTSPGFESLNDRMRNRPQKLDA
jgi:hypothetical protein